MDLKCLIMLLIEKEYITEVHDRVIDDKTILKVFECDVGFDEIYNKVRNAKYHDDIKITANRFKKHSFCILNAENLEYGLIKIGGGRERFGFRADHHRLACVPIETLINAISQHTRFDIIRQNFEDQIFFELKDSYLVQTRLDKERKKKSEVIDFLNQLP